VSPLTLGLFVVGYPLAIVPIVRWVPVVRERRLRWFLAEIAGTSAIVAGWAIEGRAGAVAVNATWGVVATVWYVLGGMRRSATD
jgi:hypothetical protein